jgi:hypothetical protein
MEIVSKGNKHLVLTDKNGMEVGFDVIKTDSDDRCKKCVFYLEESRNQVCAMLYCEGEKYPEDGAVYWLKKNVRKSDSDSMQHMDNFFYTWEVCNCGFIIGLPQGTIVACAYNLKGPPDVKWRPK